MLLGMTYYQICWYFCLFSFAGWVVEVMFHAVSLGRVINRGFLNGPVCPVYGFGVLAVFGCVNLADSSLSVDLRSSSSGIAGSLVLFLFSLVLATAVELTAGWLLDICFHMRWWDYRNRPLNFRGYICVSFSLVWGAAISLVVRILWPVLDRNVTSLIPEKYGWPLLLLIYILYIADTIITVTVVIGLNKKLRELDRIRSSMRSVSDMLSDTIGTSTIRTAQVIEEGQVQAALARAELRGSVEAARDSAQEAMHTAAAAAGRTKDAAVAAAGKTKDAAVAAAGKTKDAALAAAGMTKDAAVAAAGKTKDAAVAAAGKTKGAAVAAAGKTNDAAIAAAGKTKDAAVAAAGRTKDAALAAEKIIFSILRKSIFSPRRLLSAFPDLAHRDYGELLDELKARLKKE